MQSPPSKQYHYINIESLHPKTILPFLIIEDQRFYSHFGIDFYAVLRAAAQNIYHGKIVQGGSTITQQLVKNLYLSHQKTWERKLKELWLSLWVEFNIDKKTILTAYLNHVYFGPKCLGLQCAAKRYFSTSPQKLTLWQTAILAGMLKAPHYFNPKTKPKRAKQRAQFILTLLHKKSYISTKEYRNNIKQLKKAYP